METPAQQPAPADSSSSGAELDALKQLLSTHGKTWAVGLVLGLFAVAAIAFVRSSIAERRIAASNALSQARSIQDLEDVLARYPRYAVAPMAMLKLAKSHYDAGNPNLASSRYDEFLVKYPDHIMAAGAELGKAHCKEALNQLPDALADFRTFKKKYPDHFLYPEAVLGEARCMEQLGQYSEAKTAYEDFIAARPDSRWTIVIKTLLESVNRKIEKQIAATPPRAGDQPDTPSAQPAPANP